MKTPAWWLAHLIASLLDAPSADLAPNHLLSSYVLLILITVSTVAYGIAAAMAPKAYARRISVLVALWVVCSLSIVIWAACLVLFRIYHVV